jgi:hypothetical protein
MIIKRIHLRWIILVILCSQNKINILAVNKKAFIILEERTNKVNLVIKFTSLNYIALKKR